MKLLIFFSKTKGYEPELYDDIAGQGMIYELFCFTMKFC